MPTAYNRPLHDGEEISFEAFALRCARAFGPLRTLRDTSLDAPLPDHIPLSPYHEELLEESKARLAEIESWGIEEAEYRAQVAYEEAKAEYDTELAEQAARRERCEAMLAKVNAWRPPSDAHMRLKEFMIEQLNICITEECNTERLSSPRRQTGEVFKATHYNNTLKRIAWQSETLEEAKADNKHDNTWLQALRASLKEA